MFEKYIDDRINEINNKKPGTISEEVRERFKEYYKNVNITEDTKNEIDSVLKEAMIKKKKKKEEVKKRILPKYHSEKEKQSLIKIYIDKKIDEVNTNYNEIIITEEQRLKAYEHFKRYKHETYEEIIDIIDSLMEEAVYQSAKKESKEKEEV